MPTRCQHNTLTDVERADLVAGVEGLCRKLARRAALRWPQAGEWDDYQQAARLGAFLAAQRFQPERRLRFTTYAYKWILQALNYWCRHKGYVVHTPREAEPVLAGQIEGEEVWLAAPDEVEREWDDPAELVESLLATVSDEIDQQILRWRFGIGGEAMTLEKIAHRLGVCKERVRQRQCRAMERLRRRWGRL